MFKANDMYFVPEGLNLSEEDVKKFKLANTSWKVIAHCDPPTDTFEVKLQEVCECWNAEVLERTTI